MIIYAGKARYVGKVLVNLFIIWIGLISYSLYLVHWPIIVFFEYYDFGDVGFLNKLIIIFYSILIAQLMYLYVEKPFRKSYAISKNSNHNSNKIFAFGIFLFTMIGEFK